MIVSSREISVAAHCCRALRIDAPCGRSLCNSGCYGITWNGTPEPYAAQLTDVIDIQGYAAFDSGNFNGANVLLRDNGTWVLYFSDWQNDPQTIHRI